MPPPNLGALRAVADRLDGLGLNYAFVGGSIVNLLLDYPELSPARPTDDVDVIIEVVTNRRYSDLEARIRELGFSHDMREGAPRCRWVLGKLTVDIMPTDGASLGLNTAWFKEALATARECVVAHTRLKWSRPPVSSPRNTWPFAIADTTTTPPVTIWRISSRLWMGAQTL